MMPADLIILKPTHRYFLFCGTILPCGAKMELDTTLVNGPNSKGNHSSEALSFLIYWLGVFLYGSEELQSLAGKEFCLQMSG